MKVLKFGGSSVGSPESIMKVIDIVNKQQADTIVIVSAFQGITDQILKISEDAVQGIESYKSEAENIRQRHLTAVERLVSKDKLDAVRQHTNRLINEMNDLLYGVFLVGDLSLKTKDHLLSFGERLSSFIIANAFENAQCIDMRNCISTNSKHGNAQVDFETTNKNITESFKNFSGIAVLPGFIASNKKGQITTLGRGGSDYTAAIVAAAVKAEILEIWTDVDGFMTADPRKVSKAYVIDELSYSEALELSHFGAKVLYTPTLHPAYINNIPIKIKNTFNPGAKGTLISQKGGNNNGSLIKGISSIDQVDLISLQGSGLPGTTGTSMRLFTALAKENINIILITQASSEFSISFAVSPADTAKAEKAIFNEFQMEIEIKKIIDLKIEMGLSIIAIVGEKMKNTPGISANLFSSLGKNGISVVATAQGSSELNISVVIRFSELKKALNSIHEGFFLSHIKELHLFFVGTGNVGQKLLNQMEAQKKNLLENLSLNIKLVGLSNSRKMLITEDGVDLKNCLTELDRGEKADINTFIKRIKELNLRNSVFVDCTASEEIAAQYIHIFNQYASIVTANKIACSSDYSQYESLVAKAREKGVRFLFETNVGAGLPIISTLNDLIKSGDKIIGLEAVLSGTLNFIFNTLSEKISLSDAVKLAMEKGFSEPDPRIDLSGKDVMRKLLILSRVSGYKMEEKDVNLMPFLPKSCFMGNLDTFWSEIEKLNPQFEEKRKALVKENKKWRFVASLKEGKGSVELVELSDNHAAHRLEASNNIILITTERYKDDPMMIQGYGAGAEVTAAGIFADIIRIAKV
ncbi:MAG: bifunctional aspartate kinase/homoserine dehydrogenase I [Bacteroidales bacterium]|nr:bifunctional aspartate kinase/homoserine dehydrogenase I [Bacteroidales bacterium]MCF8389723.1 bifunctional aspartate kinase/homoserine dehydrogenase I [Bacteroidales bacterium]